MDQGILDFYRKLPRFRNMSNQEVEAIVACTRRHAVLDRGSVLFDAGASPDGAYIVYTGMLNVVVPVSPDKSKRIAQLGPGTMVGELSLIEPAPRGLRVEAEEPTQVLQIELKRFLRLRKQYHPAAYKLIHSITLTVCDRLRALNLKVQGDASPNGKALTSTQDVAIEAPAPDSTLSAWERLRALFSRE